MKYEVFFKKITEISRDCLFLPDDDEFEMGIQSFIKDIKEIADISDVELFDDKCAFVTRNGVDIATLRKLLKPIIQENFLYLRVDIVQA